MSDYILESRSATSGHILEDWLLHYERRLDMAYKFFKTCCWKIFQHLTYYKVDIQNRIKISLNLVKLNPKFGKYAIIVLCLIFNHNMQNLLEYPKKIQM